MFTRQGTTGADAIMPLAFPKTRTVLDHYAEADPGLRVFKSSPETVALQIRTDGKVIAGRRGIKRKAYSQATLTARELDAAIAELQRLRAMID